MSLKTLIALAQQFAPPGQILEVQEYGQGNVNDTYLVTLAEGPNPRFILQRLNTGVFRQPELVMANLTTVTEHVRGRLAREPLPPGRRFELPRVLPTRDGRDHLMDEQGSFWRALSFIDGAETFEIITNEPQAQEVGAALGLFHRLLADLPPGRLADTLPGFHILPAYLRYYDEILATKGAPASAEVDFCLRFIDSRRAGAAILEEAKEQGKLRICPIHGDPKVNNVMLDTATGLAVSLIDLDTVKPGLVHYDIGDCLRSGANLLGEETEEWDKVSFDPGVGRAMLRGYLQQARHVLSDADVAYLYDAIRLLAFELGLRFFTDYLAGNIYFKAQHREHNLRRALVQFKLTESIESQAPALQGLICDLS